MAFDVSYVLKVVDKYSGPLGGFIRKTKKANEAAKNYTDRLDKLGERYTKMRNLMGAAIGVSALKGIVDTAANIEEHFINIDRIVNFGGKDNFEKFQDGILKTSEYLGMLQVDYAGIVAEAAKLEPDPTKLAEFARIAAEISIAFDFDPQVAVDNAGKLTKKFGATNEELKIMADTINGIADRMGQQGSNIFKVMGGLSKEFKNLKDLGKKTGEGAFTTQEMVAWASFAERMEVSPEKAISGARAMFENFKRKFPSFAIDASEIGVTPAIMKLLDMFKGFDPRFRSMILKEAFDFSTFGVRFIESAIVDRKTLNKLMDEASDKTKNLDSMNVELEKKLRGTKTALGRIGVALEYVNKTLGDEMTPHIKESVPWIQEFSRSTGRFIKQYSGVIKIALGFTALSVAIVAVKFAFGMFATAGATVLTLLTAMKIGALAVVIKFAGIALLIAGSIYAIGSGVDYLYKNITSRDVEVFFITLWEWIKELSGYNLASLGFGLLMAELDPKIEGAKQAVRNFWTWLTTGSQNFVIGTILSIKSIEKELDLVYKLVQATWNLIKQVVSEKLKMWFSIGFDAEKEASKTNKMTEFFWEQFNKLFNRDESVSSMNMRSQIYLNGEIGVKAEGGARAGWNVFDATSPSGSVGLNMAGVA